MHLQRKNPKMMQILAASFVLVALLLPGCIGQEEEEVIFKMPISEDPTTLDPDDGYSSDLANHYRLSYNKLVRHPRRHMATDIEGELATSWDMSPDAMTWTFELRDDVTFHDGTPFNATAVKFHVERTQGMYLSPAWMYDKVDSVEVVDTYTARFHLNMPYQQFLEQMAGAWGNWIVSPTAVEKHKTADDPWAHEWFLENIAGTGPFVLDHWTREQELLYVRYDDYWEGWDGKHVDKVLLEIVPEAATIRIMLEAGDLDFQMHWGLSPSDKLAVAESPDVELYKSTSTNNLMIFFNYQKSPTNDVKVRQAISYSIDYQAICDDIMLGSATPGQGVLPKALKGHDPTLHQYTKDHTKAADLLEEAGYTLGSAGEGLRMEPLTLMYWTGNEEQRKISEYMQSELAKIGVPIVIEHLLYTAMMDMVHGDPQEAADMIFLYWYPDYADPDSYTMGMLWSEAWWNMGMYNDDRMDQLLDEAGAETDQAKRTELNNEIQRIAVDEAWMIYLYDLDNWVVYRSWVKNYYYNPIYHDTFDYWYVYVEKPEE